VLQCEAKCFKTNPMPKQATKRISVSLLLPVAKKLERIAGFHKRSTDKEAALAIESHVQKLNPELAK
jgi:hypothetical protein